MPKSYNSCIIGTNTSVGGWSIIKRLIGIICILLVLVACGESEEDKAKEKRLEYIDIGIETYGMLGLDAVTVLWNIEQDLDGFEEASSSTLFHFTDEYLLDEDAYDELTVEEKAIVMRASGMVSKFERNEYDDRSKFEEDKEELLGMLEK